MPPKKKPSSTSDPVKKYLQQIGSKGGKAGTGKAKARDSETMRAAVNKRWAKAKEAPKTEGTTNEGH